MPHNYNTRLSARLKLEAEELEFERLGQEIINKGFPEYLGKGAMGDDCLDWRQWVMDSINRSRCPYR